MLQSLMVSTMGVDVRWVQARQQVREHQGQKCPPCRPPLSFSIFDCRKDCCQLLTLFRILVYLGLPLLLTLVVLIEDNLMMQLLVVRN